MIFVDADVDRAWPATKIDRKGWKNVLLQMRFPEFGDKSIIAKLSIIAHSNSDINN